MIRIQETKTAIINKEKNVCNLGDNNIEWTHIEAESGVGGILSI